MKKTFVILTIVLAILAAPVFAEVTASGEVNYQWTFDADNYNEFIDTNDMVIDLGGTVGDYTSISAEFEAEYEDVDGVTSDGSGSRAVSMNSAEITQDITGALGLDAPVSVSVTFGLEDHDPKEYNDMAYGDFDLDGELNPGSIMTKVSLSNDMFTLDASMYEDQKFGVNAYGNVADMADVSVYYFKDFTYSAWDYSAMVPADAEDAYCLGFNTAVAVMDGLTVGAGYEMGGWSTDADIDSVSAFGLSAKYVMDALTATLGTNTVSYEDAELAETTWIAVAVDYAVNDMFSVNAAYKMPADAGDDDLADVMGYEIGAKAVVDNVTYQAGYTLGSDNEAKDAGYMDGADRSGNVYLKVGASF